MNSFHENKKYDAANDSIDEDIFHILNVSTLL